MKIMQLKTVKNKFLAATLVICVIFGASAPLAYSQLDYNYGRNNSGVRISVGYSLAMLQTHFSQNPLVSSVVGNLDYDFNPYLSVGGELQKGILQGLDKNNRLYYSSSTNSYKAANVNVKVAVGLIYDFDSKNAFQDAVKRIYIGAGAGIIKNKIDLRVTQTNASARYLDPQTNGHYAVFPFSLGTNIDLPGLLGRDKLSINPDYQFNVINTSYADGFIPSARNDKEVGLYSLYSIKLKYKF